MNLIICYVPTVLNTLHVISNYMTKWILLILQLYFYITTFYKQ